MKKINFQTILLIISLIIFVVGVFTWDIVFNLQNDNSSQKEFVFDEMKIENITWELYYSPDNAWILFYENISNINSFLKVQTYEFTEKRLRSKFKELLEKWVDIKLIMEDKKYQQFKNTWKEVQNYLSGYNNFEIKNDDQMWTEYVHSKINLVDSGFWIQTANLTHSSFNKNREHFFYSTNTWVWYSLNTIFNKDWNGEEILFEDIHPNLLVCNINCREIIESLIESADKSILIQTQYIVDDKILQILRNKFPLVDFVWNGSDLDIRFVVSDTDSNDKLLSYFGPKVARKFKKYYNHTKMILIDDEILLLWSMNLSENSLDNNREIGILIIDKNIINDFKQMFENDRKNSIF